MIAVERVEMLVKKNEKVDKIFAKKPNDGKSKVLTDCLLELFKDMGIHRFDDKLSYPLQYDSPGKTMRSTTAGGHNNNHADDNNRNSNAVNFDATKASSNDGGMGFGGLGGEPQSLMNDTFSLTHTGNITLPMVDRREDFYNESNTKQVQSLRLDHLFEELQNKLLEKIYTMLEPNNNNKTNNTFTNTMNNTLTSPTATGTFNFNNTMTTTTTGMGVATATGVSIPRLFTPTQLLNVISTKSEETIDTKSKLPTKPVVICDALPIPSNCPDTIDQLLEAALAHHNLGSFEDSLKFLEASRVQLMEIIDTAKKRAYGGGGGGGYNSTNTGPMNLMTMTSTNTGLGSLSMDSKNNSLPNLNASTNAGNLPATTTGAVMLHTLATRDTGNTLTQAQIARNVEMNFFDIRMYLTVCKGNVYQSCGDDEQSLLQYLEGLSISREMNDADWEIICLNSIGVLAFFNLRYDVAILCFYLVYEYRERVSYRTPKK
jgi:hypothetical protein